MGKLLNNLLNTNTLDRYRIPVVSRGSLLKEYIYDSSDDLSLANTTRGILEDLGLDQGYLIPQYAKSLPTISAGGETALLDPFETEFHSDVRRFSFVDRNYDSINFDDELIAQLVVASYDPPVSRSVKRKIIWTQNANLAVYLKERNYEVRLLLKRLSIEKLLEVSYIYEKYYHLLVQKGGTAHAGGY